jgi:8-oxo-dGTP pyrophosphatase MutT (NUDIX family)
LQIAKAPSRTTCGVLVSDGTRLVLGHATRSPRWDIPKGLAEEGETFVAAAIRELQEETSLIAPPNDLVDLGVHDYLPSKRLALFGWYQDLLPNPQLLVCRSTALIGGILLPELDRFEIFSWDEGLSRVGKNLARVLRDVGLPFARNPGD